MKSYDNFKIQWNIYLLVVIIMAGNDYSGLQGLQNIFKKEAEESNKITFIGSPGLCTPFSEFLAFGVQDKETHFIPFININDCHEFELNSCGLALKEEVSDPHDSDIVVLMGGLAMPDFNVDVDQVKSLTEEILKKDGRIFGVCFMDMFSEYGWLEKINFDCIIDGTLITMIKK